jgi:hypothetical protein
MSYFTMNVCNQADTTQLLGALNLPVLGEFQTVAELKAQTVEFLATNVNDGNKIYQCHAVKPSSEL